jgi:hypothetical protein
LQAQAPAAFGVEHVHQRRAQVTARDHGWQRELRIREPRSAREDPAIRPVHVIEERCELGLSHQSMLSGT